MVLHGSLTSFRKLSIPRDSYAAIPNCGTQKINASFACNTRSNNGNPAVVLLDLKLPKVDGLEVLREIKSNQNFKAIPVVMITSSTQENDLARSYHLGVNAYVVKPVNYRDFISAVRQVGAFWAVVNEPPPEAMRKPN